MKVTLDRTFPMPAGPDVAWGVLSDIEAVASCMPGAKITERIDDTHYKGTVTVKVGPAQLAFRGDIEVTQCEAVLRQLRLLAKGTDTSGTSFASMDLTARVEQADEGRSNLVGRSEASVGGKAATFGGRMMDAVSDQILKQFAANFAARVEAQQPSDKATVDAPPAREAPPASAEDGAPQSASNLSPAAAAPAAPLNGIALLWAVIRDWLRGLFSSKSA